MLHLEGRLGPRRCSGGFRGSMPWHAGRSREWRLGEYHAAPEVCHDDVGHLHESKSQHGLNRYTTMLGDITEDHCVAVQPRTESDQLGSLLCTPLASECSQAQCHFLLEHVLVLCKDVKWAASDTLTLKPLQDPTRPQGCRGPAPCPAAPRPSPPPIRQPPAGTSRKPIS